MSKSKIILIMLIALILMPALVLSSGKNKSKRVKITNSENKPVPVKIIKGEEDGMQTTAEYRFVGFTNTRTQGVVSHPDGTLGSLAMHRYCQDEVAPNSRACYSSEVNRPPAVTPENMNGWVLRTQDVSLVVTAPDTFRAVDAGSGIISNALNLPENAVNDLDCGGYSKATFAPGLEGLLFGQEFSGNSGTVFRNGCTSNSQIACCALIAVPVTTQSSL